MRYPLLIDAFIRAIGESRTSWFIKYTGEDCHDNKPYYICRWLNHSFMPFTKRQRKLFEQVMAAYTAAKKNKL